MADKKTLRVIDANFNRLTEALRVIEDICRFVLDDGETSSLIKDYRLKLSPRGDEYWTGVGSRDTEGDVGVDINGEAEFRRSSVLDIAIANFKRAEESLRVLEEFYKLVDESKSRFLKGLRYSMYSLEKRIVSKLKDKYESEQD